MRTPIGLIALSACAAAFAAPITQLKPLYPRTELVVGGQARCVIVTPEREDLSALAHRLAARLERAGGARPDILSADAVISAGWQIDLDRISGRALVALGNPNNNRLLARLWGMGYVCTSSIFPGEGGHVIRTVHDPFAAGVNVLALSGSNAAGVERAVEVFCEKYVPDAGDVVLPQPVLDVHFTPTYHRFYPEVHDWSSSKRQPQYSTIEWFRGYLQSAGLMAEDGSILRRDTGTLVDVTGPIARLAQSWFWTGDPALPPLMKQILDANRHLLAIVPHRVEMEAASAAHVPWWDIVEELPIWTDRDRLDITNALLADALQGHERRAAHQMVREGYVQVVDENHGTNSALNSWTAWQYFDRYYDLPETDYWMAVAAATFLGQCASHQTLEDAAGYLTYAPEDAIGYALGSGDLRYLDLGVARTQAEFIAQACVSNLGLGTGFGDSSGLVYPSVFQVLARAGWYYRDPYLLWVAYNMLHPNCGLRVFQVNIPVNLDIETRVPEQWTGMRRLPIYVQTLTRGEGAREPVFDPPESVGDQWFNKIVFREAWDPEAQYLLLDGCGKFGALEGYPNGPAGHKHDDINTIPCFTDVGRMWLVDHTYASRAISDHSGLTITRDGQLGYDDHEARLLDFAEGDELALCRSVYDDFSGATWERTIFWRRGEHFAIIDRAIAEQPGQYVVRCSFRGLGEHTLADGRLRLEQDGRFCQIISDGGAQTGVKLFDLPAADHWTSFYPWAEPVAKIFEQDKSRALQPGEAIGFANVIAASADEAELNTLQVLPVSEQAVLVESAAGPLLYGLGEIPGGPGAAACWAIAPDEVLLSGAPAGLGAQVEAARDDIFAEARRLAAGYTPPGGVEVADVPMVETTMADLGTPIVALLPADLDRDGADEWLTVGSEGATAFATDGARLWQFAPGAACVSIDAGDLDGDGVPEIAVGCEDRHVYLLDASGEQRWRFACKAGDASLVGPPVPEMVRIADLEGDGTPEIIVGANYTHCLTPEGDVRWEHYLRFARGRVCGDFARGLIADVDADGELEVVSFYRDSYHKGVIYAPDGTQKVPAPDADYGFNTPLALDALAVNLYGRDDGLHIVLGGDTRLYEYWGFGQFAGQSAGRKSGCFPHLAAWRPAGEKPFVYAATDMGAVIAWRNQQDRNDEWVNLDSPWSRVLGGRISALGVIETAAGARLLVGMEDGSVRVLDATTGEDVARTVATGSPVVGIIARDIEALIVHADGVVEALAI